MTETDEKPEEKKPVKQGLHGWKAALAMFGCGSLAAFAIFGVVTSVLGSFLSMFSDGVEVENDDPSIPQDTANPREEFDGEKFDLCAISEDAQGVNISFSGYPIPEDSSLNGGPAAEGDLVRTGQCSGDLVPSSGGEPWGFELSYTAIIYSPEGDEEDFARDYFAESSGRMFASGEQGVGETVDFLDRAQAGHDGSAEAGSEYSLLVLKRSAVLEINLTSPGEQSAEAFFGELKQLERRYDVALEANIPE
ncbi:hypothetical protein [Nocardiopsis kunsanensis]|uniref:hypothetical protein n=1 Tax=Nocardiopsis kunsanensis TaxID=141693 RepID=UPI0003448CFD|nr:hypothetical protein [Nocardiopsis kunsanensis]